MLATYCSTYLGDFAERFQSVRTEEWMYVFKPQLAETVLYVKVILRSHCILVSFQDESNGHEDHV